MSSDVMNTLRSQVAAGDTTTALRDRFWTMGSGGSLTPDVLERIDPETGGIVLTGETAAASAADIRSLRPDLPLLINPTSADKHAATADKPFVLLDEGVLFEQTVQEALAIQRHAGATMVITPSGQIGANDVGALKAVVNGANAITDPDVVTLVVVQSDWLTGSWLKTLCAVLRTSTHPVLLGLARSFANPLDAVGALEGYQKVAADVGSVVGWQTDLSGLGLVAHGALGAAVGLRPSARRYAEIGLHPRSSDKRDRTPHVLLPDLMRYSRSSHMQKEWFAQAQPDVCDRPCCRGGAVDRFDGTEQSVDVAHAHNTTVLSELASDLVAGATSGRASWWRRQITDAIAAHAELGERIRREVVVPTDLKRWNDLLSA